MTDGIARDRAPRVTVAMVNYRTPELAIRSLEALAGERGGDIVLDAILVDGGSGDGSAERLVAWGGQPAVRDWVTVVPLAFNGGFGWANNQAIRRALRRDDPADYILLLNPDAVAEPGAIGTLVAALEADRRAAAAGSRLLDDADRVLGSAFRFPDVAREFFRGANTPAIERLLGTAPLMVQADTVTRVDWVTGASVMLRAAALREAGLFDEGFFLYFEEVELMHRLRRAGWHVLHVPDSRVRHVGGAATGVGDDQNRHRQLPDYWFRSRRRFFARAYGPARARLAGLAWIAGFGVWRLRELAGLGRASGHAQGEMRSLIRNGIGAAPSDGRAAVGRWDDPLDERPAWAAWS